MKKYFVILILLNFLLTNLIFGQEKKNILENDKVKITQDSLDYRLENLTKQITDGLTENQKRTIAVIEFVDLKGNVTDFGRYLSEELITRLYQTKKFKVIERQMLNKVITEQKLSLTGIIEPSAAQKLGRLLGVDAIASGSVSDLGKSLKVNARLIGTETGEIFSVASVTIVKDDEVCTLLGGCKDSNTTAFQTEPTKPKPTPNSTPEKPKSWVIKNNFFTFELLGCKSSGEMAICDIEITNNGDDRNLKFYTEYGLGGDGTKIYDNNNNVFSINDIRLNGGKGGASFAYSWVYAFFINGIKTKANFEFKGLKEDSSKISLLVIYAKTDNANEFKIQFRNIPFEKL
jgi:TolB-like protein